MAIEIRTGSIAEAVAVSMKIPEFSNPHEAAEYQKRLSGKQHLTLIAYDGSKAIGFKVGYDKEKDGSFYSWMGGIVPAYRERQIAKNWRNIRRPGRKKADLQKSGSKPVTATKPCCYLP